MKKKKTLIDLLQENKYQVANVKIRSKNGSSFWYCGKGKLSSSLPAIKRARETTLRWLKNTIKQQEYRLEHLDELYEKAIKNAKGKVKNYELYQKQMATKRELERVKIPKVIKSLKEDVEVDLLDRKVEEVVYGISPDEVPCWIVCVKGNEKGNFWTIKEYEKRYKEK